MLDKKVKVGEEVVLECLSNGYPKPKISWKKDGNLLTTSTRHFFTANDQLLVIMETITDDSGIYQCEIANSLGVKLQEVEIIIMPCKYFSTYTENYLFLVFFVNLYFFKLKIYNGFAFFDK